MGKRINVENMEIIIENSGKTEIERLKKIYSIYIADKIKEYLMNVPEDEREGVYNYIINLLVQNN